MKLLYTAIVILLLSSCYTKQGALRRFCKQDSVTFNAIVPVSGIVKVDSDSAQFNLDCERIRAMYDSLLRLPGNPIDTNKGVLVYEDSNLQVHAKPSASGGIDLTTETKEKDIPFTANVPVEVKVPCNCPELPTPAWYQKYIDTALYCCAFLGIVFIIYIFIRLK